MGIESPLFEFRENPFCVVFVVGRADVMRTSAHAAHVLAHVVADDAILKLLLPLVLRAGGLGRVARKLSRGGGFRGFDLRTVQLCNGKNYAARNE